MKINPAHLEPARGLRVGIVPSRQGKSDKITLDSQKNLVVCPIPHDGSQVNLDGEQLVCTSGTLQPTTGGSPVIPPQACYHVTSGCTAQGGGNGADGGTTVNDQWHPAVAYVSNPDAGAEVLMTWFDTRNDPNNNLATIWGMSLTGGSWGQPYQVGVATPDAGQTVPWDHTLGASWDYQGLSSEPWSYTFLGAWGGDARLGAGKSGVWSAAVK